MRFSRRKTARAVIFNPKTKLFLLAKGVLPPFRFHLPGGGIDKDESVEEAMRRELQEELNIQAKDISAVTFISKQDEYVMLIPHTAHIFIVEVKNVALKLSWEIWEVEWVDKKELLKRVYMSDVVRLSVSAM